MSDYSYTTNAEIGYIDGLYQQYKQDPTSVDSSWQKFFEGVDFSIQLSSGSQTNSVNSKEINVLNLINGYRDRGHLLAKTNPIRERKDRHPHLDLSDFGLVEEDLNSTFEISSVIGLNKATLKDIIDKLQKMYCQSIGVEYNYIENSEEREWFQKTYEDSILKFDYPLEKETKILRKLNQAVVFENFLHTKYVGQKRFSLEGGETTIPALDAIINAASKEGVKEVVIGMAHRGRLNVLANILGKTYDYIFNEFEGNAKPDQTMGDGDVKYHQGFSSQLEADGGTVYLKLMPNPSHLEAVNSVVCGFARAKSDALYSKNNMDILGVLIHGDAALAGQGVVYEVGQMANLEGYHTGGTIHFVINNQIGFTTDFDDARSSIYCTGVAKVTDCPIIHVNGDMPESVVYAAELAVQYRTKFKKDIYIDMVCYRKYGHNESDEPKFTQPYLYSLINKHENPRDVYAEQLISRGVIQEEMVKAMEKEFKQILTDRLNSVKENPLPYAPQITELQWQQFRKSTSEDFDSSPETKVSKQNLELIVNALTSYPSDITPIKKVEKLLQDRAEKFKTDKLDWAMGELMAYGSLLLEGFPVRMSGQDVTRGTFSHRHAGIFDEATQKKYINLNFIKEGQSEFQIYNSLLSEYAVMGFEYGYALASPNTLTIWEAQFGDFSNGAQTMIDQFISSGESKWQRQNGMVLLLPHGYEGQGPEHSSARPERFLQLAAENNIVVANCTTPANFFHLIRRQLKWEFRKPLIVTSPKSLLRSPQAVSKVSDFTDGKFQELIDDIYVTPKSVKRVLFCSGKIYYDLLERQQTNKVKDIAIIRIEQLYPMPEKQIDVILEKYSKAEMVWIQEEPKNMGAWTYWLRRDKHLNFRLISRKSSASPATGYLKVHVEQQTDLVNQAFTL